MDGTAASGDRDQAEGVAGIADPADKGDAGHAAVDGPGTSAPPTGEPSRMSRTGRNLPVAVAVGVALGVVVLSSLYLVKTAFLVVVLVAVGLAVHEMASAFAIRGIRVPLIPLLVGLAAMVVGPYLGGATVLAGAFAVTVLVLVAWRMFRGASGYVRDTTASVFIAAYPSLLAGFIPLLLHLADGADRVVVFIAVTVCSDIGGYFAGILFGRHRMSPLISPKKTWEGFAGSAVACTVGGALLVHFLLDAGYWQGAIIGAAAVIFATLGDLVESVIKRDIGIKDMGTLLPGHGGLMDRLDSLLFTIVPIWLLLTLLVPA